MISLRLDDGHRSANIARSVRAGIGFEFDPSLHTMAATIIMRMERINESKCQGLKARDRFTSRSSEVVCQATRPPKLRTYHCRMFPRTENFDYIFAVVQCRPVLQFSGSRGEKCTCGRVEMGCRVSSAEDASLFQNKMKTEWPVTAKTVGETSSGVQKSSSLRQMLLLTF